MIQTIVIFIFLFQAGSVQAAQRTAADISVVGHAGMIAQNALLVPARVTKMHTKSKQAEAANLARLIREQAVRDAKATKLTMKDTTDKEQSVTQASRPRLPSFLDTIPADVYARWV